MTVAGFGSLIGMRTFLGLGLLWFGLGGIFAAGQGGTTPKPQATTLIEPPAPLLPTTDKLIQPTADLTVPADSAEAQAVMKEDGLQRTESRAVVSPIAKGTAKAGWVTAYEFGDATGALAAYTYFRAVGKQSTYVGRVNGTDVRLALGNERLVLSGVSVVRASVSLYPESADALLKSIEVGLPKVSGRRGVAPLLPTLLPPVGQEAASLRYAVGPTGYQAMSGQLPADVLGWDKSVEVATANYAGKPGKGTLTLLMYPTPQIAGDRLRAVQQAVDAAGNKTLGTLVLRRVGPMVGVTTGAWTEAQAKALLGSLHLNEEVTFDQKMPVEFHVEIRKTASLLENILVFSGILALAAVLLGVFLGGGRAWIRKLQGKPVYVEQEFLTISLRESATEHFEKLHVDHKG
jgi:hypothetical protein